jgi:hypothetical protein
MLMVLWLELQFPKCHVMSCSRTGLTNWSSHCQLDSLECFLVVLRKKMTRHRKSQGRCWNHVPCGTGEARHGDS